MDSSQTAAIAPAISQGATLVSETKTRFDVWAPQADRVRVEIIRRDGKQEAVSRTVPLDRSDDGFHTGTVGQCSAGTLYRFKLDDKMGRPDPYSRFQPFGVHGPSQVVDPQSYQWKDQQWRGIKKRDLIVYELHVGSFTHEGTYLAAIEKIAELKKLGITAIELLPVAQTPGRWNWGYDGVNFFAPRNSFGTADELKAFIDACHSQQIAVLLDVVYNHVGPEGNYLSEFGPYPSPKHDTPWGDSLNFDGPDGKMVREFIIANVLFWIDEYHFDGLRLDAIHYMFDESDSSIVHEIRQRFREYQKTIERTVYLIAESNIYDPHLLHDEDGESSNYDAIWSDCLMHSIYSHGNPDVRLTNRHYVGSADLAEALEHAYVYSAPRSAETHSLRVGLKDREKHHPSGDRQYIESLVMALQTHDSVGNHPHGKRLHQLTSFEFQKAAAPLILLYPCIPMIFMGEEWATDAPFPFFADFEDPALRAAVDKGRRDEYPHHDWADSPLPSDPAAFFSSKSIPADRQPEMWNWYQQLLALRKQGIQAGWLDVKTMSTEYEPTTDFFQLIYQTPEQKVVVGSRLAMQGADSIKLTHVQAATIEMNSQLSDLERNQREETSEFELAAQQCCVWIEPLSKSSS